jgi:hypothetical protein
MNASPVNGYQYQFFVRGHPPRVAGLYSLLITSEAAQAETAAELVSR